MPGSGQYILARRTRTLPLESPTLLRPLSSILAAILLLTPLLSGCTHSRSHAGRHPLPPLIQAPPDAPATELVVDRQMKVVMGRLGSVEQITRVAQEIGPVLRQAIDQESIQPLIQQDAAGAQKSVDDFKSYFVQKQEADILLESGGDPNAVSPAGAAGAAQWLPVTGRGRGRLKIDATRSKFLTAQIDSLSEDIHRLRAQPPEFTETLPVGSTAPNAQGIAGTSGPPAPSGAVTAAADAPGADQPGLAPATRVWNRDELISFRQQQVRDLTARRREIDQRFDPQLALFAQTRYLIWMWNKYPSLDWVFEAYHGGEEGTEHTLKTYLGDQWKVAGSVTHAILGENASGQKIGPPISYSDIFFSTTPRTHPAAFAYLYGLHDEHRTYWFKLLMAERAIAWYRRDPKSFADECEALRPGYPLEDAWYPDVAAMMFPNIAAVHSARNSGVLSPLVGAPLTGVNVGTLPFIPPAQALDLAVARPEALGALKLVTNTYHQESLHPLPLSIVALTQPSDLSAQIRARFPTPAPRNVEPGAPPPASLPDLHSAGLTLAILKPTNAWEDRVLQYALSYWEDRERIYFKTETWGNLQAWRVVPNPVYRDELVAAMKKV